MIKRILVANRGEIAVRVMRSCREMEITSIAIFSEADRTAKHVLYADEAYCVGPAASKESYLNIEKIIEVAKANHADAIHPGYGFLSENANFARRCQEEGIIFIGPDPETMEAMGDKISARIRMIEAGVPVVPGTQENLKSVEEAVELCNKIGYPVMLKASMGGGGKGMRLIHSAEEVEEAYTTAKSESLSSFGDDTVYLEKFAVAAAKAVNYIGAGTIEFLVDKHRNYYFLEMNTRLQVEHPITEEVVGVDLVKEQIKVADGQMLQLKQEDIKQRGHAIECRICAEDTEMNFMPSPGIIKQITEPNGIGVRIDSYVYEGYEIPIYYDPMIGKLIVWATNREYAIERMRRVLHEYKLTGVKNNISYLRAIMDTPDFVEGHYDTGFITKNGEHLHQCIMRTSERAENIALIAAYMDYLMNLEENSGDTTDNRPISKWKEFGLHKGVLRI
jgi:acetyl-CoA carboxylase biotin carboxylase subunit